MRGWRRRSAVVGVVILIAACGPSEATPSESAGGATGPSAVATATAAPTASPTASPPTAYWIDATASTIGATAEWTNKVELADLDADGDVDILFANGGLYETPGSPEPTRVLINDGQARFEDRTSEILGDVANLARVVKVRDLDGDSLVDIVIGNTYQTQSRLFLGRGGLEFEEVTATHFPDAPLSVGDLEAGDVDGDGDLDLVLADWGPGNPMRGASAPPRLWINDGTATFSAASDAAIPDEPRGFSWDIEFIDVDGDLDLDILESCKMCDGGLLLHNDGSGVFVDASDQLPAASNNYEFEPMDVDGDGVLDVVTINDGPDATERLLLGNGVGGFTDATGTLWPTEANPPADDNVVVFLDAESDGDPDFLIGSLDGTDRLLVNDGSGRLSLDAQVFGAPASTGTLGMAVADLDGDGRLDVVEAQGEVVDPDLVYRGVGIPPDTAAPVVASVVHADGVLTARVTDHTSSLATSLGSVVVVGPDGERPMTWYGEYLWRAEVPEGDPIEVCATDVAGNRGCAASPAD
jgi:hypothetical protein